MKTSIWFLCFSLFPKNIGIYGQIYKIGRLPPGNGPIIISKIILN